MLSSVRARQYSETIVSLVIGQIREATRPDGKTGLFGGREPAYWTSQPGMIRTYDREGFHKAFKLYSSHKMIVEDSIDLATEGNSLIGWEQEAARFVDLNEPSISYDHAGIETNRVFPILDPRARTLDRIEGFEWDENAMAGIGNASKVNNGERLPMPVEWLYMLKDGTLGSLSEEGRFQSAEDRELSAHNPMVARLAFWTDDETCKVNVNTAAEGVAWGTPYAATEEGRDWGEKQPVTNEVQRYPGHPATTCLSSYLLSGSLSRWDGRGGTLSSTACRHL